MEYILFIHSNANTAPTSEDWNEFLNSANESGTFLGGSEISNQIQIGNKPVRKITDEIGGFMRFEAENVNIVLELLKKHPVFVKGGTLELCEMPRT